MEVKWNAPKEYIMQSFFSFSRESPQTHLPPSPSAPCRSISCGHGNAAGKKSPTRMRYFKAEKQRNNSLTDSIWRVRRPRGRKACEVSVEKCQKREGLQRNVLRLGPKLVNQFGSLCNPFVIQVVRLLQATCQTAVLHREEEDVRLLIGRHTQQIKRGEQSQEQSHCIDWMTSPHVRHDWVPGKVERRT